MYNENNNIHGMVIIYQSNPKPEHISGGSGRAAHGRAAGRGGLGRMGRRSVCSHRTQPSLVLSWASKTIVLNNSSEARAREILCKPSGEQNVRLTSGLRPVYRRDEKRSLFLAADQCTDAYLSL